MHEALSYSPFRGQFQLRKRKSTWNVLSSIIFSFLSSLLRQTFPPQLYNLKTCKLATLAPCIPLGGSETKENMPFSAFLKSLFFVVTRNRFSMKLIHK